MASNQMNFSLLGFQVLFHRVGRRDLDPHLLADELDPINLHELYLGNIFAKGIPRTLLLPGNCNESNAVSTNGEN